MTPASRLWAAAVVVAAVCVLTFSGCLEFEGIRWAPSEPVRQSAQIGSDLSAALAATGAPPGSPALRSLAKSSAVGAAYAGSPSEPVDITALLDPETTDAFGTLRSQKAALAARDNIRRQTWDLLAGEVADLAESVAGKAQVAGDWIVPRLHALVIAVKIGETVADGVPVPADPGTDPAAAAARDALEAAAARLAAAAQSRAARPPKGTEIVQHVVAKTDETAATIGDLIDTYWPGGLAALGGAGGVFYAARKRRDAKAAAGQVQEAELSAADSRAEAQRAKVDAAEIVSRAMDKLAAAQPAAPVSIPPAAAPSPPPENA